MCIDKDPIDAHKKMNGIIDHMKNILLNKFDALLVTNPTNIRYSTGFVGAAPEEREAYIVLTRSRLYLFINALYIEAARNAECRMPNVKLEIVEISRDEPFAKKLAEILTGPGPVSQLDFEKNNLTVAEYEKLKKELPGITLIPTQNRIEELRMIKRDDEIKNIRKAAALTDRCFTYLSSILKPSVTEAQIAWEIESFIRTRGASLAFSPIVAFGPHTSQPHYNPTKLGFQDPQSLAFMSASQQSRSNQSQALKSNDIILLDLGARVNGYCSDMTRTIFFGKPEAQWVKAYETVLQAQAAALEYLASRPGLERGGDTVDRMARDVIEKAGFPTYPHSLGHGVGLDIHEAPRLRVKPPTNSGQTAKQIHSEKLSAGMVVTVEPGIYIEGQYGIRIEDLILLKEDGIEILSKSNKNVIVL